MKRTLKTRVLVALTATIVSAACGLLAGYWIGRTIILRQTAVKLSHEAARAMSESDMYARDVHGALDAMNVRAMRTVPIRIWGFSPISSIPPNF